MFKIDVTRFWWIQDNGDDPLDFCPNGTDWSIVHENGKIKLVLEDGYETVVQFDEYRNEV